MNVVIVGRGVAGLSCGYILQQRRPDIKLTFIGLKGSGERASEVAQGIVTNKGLKVAFAPLFQAKLSSLRSIQTFLDEIEKASGRRIPRSFAGVAEPLLSDEHYRRTFERIYKRRYWGLFGTECHLQPELAAFYPRDGFFAVEAALAALELCFSARAKHIDDTVAAVDHRRSQVFLQGGRAALAYDQLILANGAGLQDLLAASALPYPELKYIAGANAADAGWQFTAGRGRGDGPLQCLAPR